MKYLLPTLMMLLFFGVIIGANIYLARSFNNFFALNRLTLLYLTFGIASLFMLFGGMSTINATGSIGHLVNIFSFTLLGFFLYLLLSTLFVDLISLIIKLTPITKGVSTLVMASVIAIYGIINARITRITQESLIIPGMSQKIKAMHLTDTHLGHFRGGKTLQKLVERINREKVDVVFFTGDLLDGRIELKKESMRPLANLEAPIFFVEGNHDLYTGVDAIKGYLKEIGVKVLTNEVIEWNGLQIIGLNHMIADSATYDMHATGRMTVQSALERLQYNSEKPLILLHHGPAGIKYAIAAGVDLYLAGHTHGGQMFPATLIAQAIFEFNKGLHKIENTYIHVCEGTGTFGPPMRVGTISEMTVLNLKPN